MKRNNPSSLIKPGLLFDWLKKLVNNCIKQISSKTSKLPHITNRNITEYKTETSSTKG